MAMVLIIAGVILAGVVTNVDVKAHRKAAQIHAYRIDG
jgi:hypothetical protein